MAKPLINNVKRGKLVEKEGGFLDYEKQPLDYISCYSSYFASPTKIIVAGVQNKWGRQ
jgi:hypothetical protein